MKNIITSAAILISLILFIRISVLSGNQEQNGLCFSYLNGQIMFDYDPNSNFLYYYKKLSQIARAQENNKLRRLHEKEIDNNINIKQTSNILDNIYLDRSGIKHLNYNSQSSNPAVTPNIDCNWLGSEAQDPLNKMVKSNLPSNSMITTPCGMCNNFPIVFTSANEIVETSTFNSSLISQSFSSESQMYCSPTPEPQTIFLFGSALIGMGVFRHFRRKKTK